MQEFVENYYEAVIRDRLADFLGPETPFEYVRAIPRKSHARRDVFEVKLRRAQLPHVSENTKWYEPVHADQHLILKVLQPIELERGEEIHILEKVNTLFVSSDTNRPVRMIGSGISVMNGERIAGGWIAQEPVPEHFTALEKYLPVGKRIHFLEALELAIALAENLQKLHHGKVAHGDLDGAGMEQHLFWDPFHFALRVIDFGDAHFKESAKPLLGIAVDQTGVGQVLARGITGQDFHPETLHSQLSTILGKTLAASVGQIIEEAIGVSGEAHPHHYSHSAAGTAQLYADLIKVREIVSSEV